MGKKQKEQESVSPELYTEEYFRTACEGYDEFNETEGENLSRRLSAAIALAEIKPGMKVLDVGCGRGEILRHCAKLGADAFGIDYAPAAIQLSQQVLGDLDPEKDGQTGVVLADAKKLPFASEAFSHVFMFDVVEHLHPWELHEAMLEVHRVLKSDGHFIIHTAPNIWYDRYAYPFVRFFRRLGGNGANYPKNPRRFLVGHNVHVHVNEQSLWSLSRTLKRAGFEGRVWLDSPPQNRDENLIMTTLRKLAFGMPPLRWFFEREVFAVAVKSEQVL